MLRLEQLAVIFVFTSYLRGGKYGGDGMMIIMESAMMAMIITV